jgi:hypothetical protein
MGFATTGEASLLTLDFMCIDRFSMASTAVACGGLDHVCTRRKPEISGRDEEAVLPRRTKKLA